MKKSRQLEMVQYQRHCGNEYEQAHDPSPGFKNKKAQVGVNPPPNALDPSARSKGQIEPQSVLHKLSLCLEEKREGGGRVRGVYIPQGGLAR